MDVRCIQQCIDPGFDSDTCVSCEDTRPIIVRKELTSTMSTYLEDVANMELGMH